MVLELWAVVRIVLDYLQNRDGHFRAFERFSKLFRRENCRPGAMAQTEGLVSIDGKHTHFFTSHFKRLRVSLEAFGLPLDLKEDTDTVCDNVEL